jgi:excisionase family DNA binding protein
VTVREAAALLGVSVQSVHKACRVGRIRVHHVRGIRVLERDGLERRWWGSSQRLADRPAPPLAAEPPDWQQIAAAANPMLDPALWGPPPWPADRWATLAMVISLAEEQAAA